MFALRRASNPLRNVGYTLGISRACCSKFETPKSLESRTGVLKPPQAVPGGCLSVERFYHSKDFSSQHSLGRRGFSSQTGKKSSGEEDDLPDLEYSELAEVIRAARSPAHRALDKWIAEGKELGRKDISLVIHTLSRLEKYKKALQVWEWVEENKRLDFDERDYASRLVLIGRVHGLQKADDYFQNVPQSFKGKVPYWPPALYAV